MLVTGSFSLPSVLSDDKFDLRTAYTKVIKHFDPNRSQNRKTHVLDCTYSYVWNKNDLRLFGVDDRQNLKNLDNRHYDLILYEPVKNNRFIGECEQNCQIFSQVINVDGILIVKMSDFREPGKTQLHGSFEVWDICCKNGFYLTDNIIYNFRSPYLSDTHIETSQIVHLSFMIFNKQS